MRERTLIPVENVNRDSYLLCDCWLEHGSKIGEVEINRGQGWLELDRNCDQHDQIKKLIRQNNVIVEFVDGLCILKRKAKV